MPRVRKDVQPLWREGAVECRVLVCRLTRARRHAPDWAFVEPQSSPFFKKRSIVWVEKEEMSYEGTPVKATPTSRRRMMLPTPQPSSRSSIEDMQWQTEMEVQRSSRNARERTVIARMEQYLHARNCTKMEIVGLEDLLLVPEDAEVNLRYILRNATRRGGRIFEIFNTKEKKESTGLQAKCSGMSDRG